MSRQHRQANRHSDADADFWAGNAYAGHPFASDTPLPEHFDHANPHPPHHFLRMNERSSINPQLMEAERVIGNGNLAPVDGDHDTSFVARNAAANAFLASKADPVSDGLAAVIDADTVIKNVSGSAAVPPIMVGDELFRLMPAAGASQNQTASEDSDGLGFPGTGARAWIPSGQSGIDRSAAQPLSAEPLSTSTGEGNGTCDGLIIPPSLSPSSSGNPGETGGYADEVAIANYGSRNAGEHHDDDDAGNASEVYHSEFDDESNDEDGGVEDQDSMPLPRGGGGNPQTTQAGVSNDLLPSGHAPPSYAAGMGPQSLQDATCDSGQFPMTPGLSGGQPRLDSYTGVNNADMTSSSYDSSLFSSMGSDDSSWLSPLTRQSSADTVWSPGVLPESSTGLTLQGGQGQPAPLDTCHGQAFDMLGSTANPGQPSGQSSASSVPLDSSGLVDVPGFSQNTAGLQALHSNKSALGVPGNSSRFSQPTSYQQPIQRSSTWGNPLVLQHPQLDRHLQPSTQKPLRSESLDHLSWPAPSQQCDQEPQGRQNLRPVQIRQPPRNEFPAAHHSHGGAAIAPERLPPHTPASRIFPPNTDYNQYTITRQRDEQTRRKRRTIGTCSREDQGVKRARSAVTDTFQQPHGPRQYLQVPQQLLPIAPQHVLRSSPLIQPVPPHLILKSSPATTPGGSRSVPGKRPGKVTPSVRRRQLQHPATAPQATTEQDFASQNDVTPRKSEPQRR